MKKLLLIGLRYHHYTEEIIRELSLLGYEVKYHEIQPRTFYYKALRVLAPAAYQASLDRHHRAILSQERGVDYELVLFIQAHQFSADNLRALREQHRSSKFVLYNWDSLKTHDYRPNMGVFDKVFTFDPDDARSLGVNYLPLFCVRTFQGLRRREQDRRAVYFVGNIVSVQRYEALQAFKRYCNREGITFHCFMACSPVVFLLLLRAGHRPRDVSFRSISHDEFVFMIERSTTVFDFANHQQSGYTMRIVENLCAGKKIISNNPRLTAEPFYSPDRIMVFNGLDFSEVKAFVELDLVDPDAKFEQYQIQTFVRTLVS